MADETSFAKRKEVTVKESKTPKSPKLGGSGR
jgi:hypothetical protein